MRVRALRTHKITEADKSLLKILDKHLKKMSENSILVITSKIVSICEGRIVPFGTITKDELVVQDSDYYIPREENIYHYLVTIRQNAMIPTAGIDESNSHNHYVLLPANAQKTANKVRAYLRKRFHLRHAGVIITDSKTIPFRWGSVGFSLAHSGFAALHDYRHTQDLFGREMKITQANLADAFAAAAVAVMGEGIEQTPLAIIDDVDAVTFQPRNPTAKELKILYPAIERDLYSSIIMKANWRKGKRV